MEYLIKKIADILSENGIPPTNSNILNVLRWYNADIGIDQDEIYSIVKQLYPHPIFAPVKDV